MMYFILEIVVHALHMLNKERGAGCGKLRLLAGYGKPLHKETHHVKSIAAAYTSDQQRLIARSQRCQVFDLFFLKTLTL
jgi:hypothetical protein